MRLRRERLIVCEFWYRGVEELVDKTSLAEIDQIENDMSLLYSHRESSNGTVF